LADTPLSSEIEILLVERLSATRDVVASNCKVEGPLVRGGSSAIYRATCPGFGHPLLIKRPDETGTTAIGEYRALCLARDRLSNSPGLLVPNAYPYLLEDGFLMIEWINGCSLGLLIRKIGTMPGTLAAKIEQTGRWLKAFHSGGDQRLGHLEPDRMLDNLRSVLGVTEHRTIGWHLKSLIDLLHRSAPKLVAVPIPIALQHGDFKPDNILIDGDHVVGIDIGAAYTSPIVEDISHFFFHLDMHLLQPPAWHLLPWRRRLRLAFMHGYGLDRSPSLDAVLAWAELQRTLRLSIERAKVIEGSVRKLYLSICYGLCAQRSAWDLNVALSRL